MLEEEAAFPSHDSLDLTSSGESGCEESQEQLLGAGQPRLLADCSLLFLLCQSPKKSEHFGRVRQRPGSQRSGEHILRGK